MDKIAYNILKKSIRMPSLASGFTLIETFVAILVLTAAVVGPMSIAQKGLQSASLAKDKTTAAYLAQDAIEYINWIKTSNFYAKANWLYNFVGKCDGPNQYCIVDTTLIPTDPIAIKYCGNTEGACSSFPLLVDKAGGTYQYGYNLDGTRSNWEATKFVREIRVIAQGVGQESNLPPPSFPEAEALIDVKMTWNQGSLVRNYYLRSTITNWLGSY